MTYLEPTDKDAFKDYPLQKRANHMPESWVQCPLCSGHGGWNLKLNAYRMHGHADTPENRHRFSHFRANCSQCNGWGFVAPDNTACIHKWVQNRNVGRCLNEYKCSGCGKISVVDSSD